MCAGFARSSASRRNTSRPSPASATSSSRPGRRCGGNMAKTPKAAHHRRRRPPRGRASPRSLELDGFECHQAGAAKDGIDAAVKIDPDVVIMDIQLPDSSGFQICQELRKRSKITILIMMTGRFLSSEEKKQGLRARRRRVHHQALRPRRASRPASSSFVSRNARKS